MPTVCTGMAETPNRRAASAAAREFLHTKVDRIGDLAEAARTVDAAVEARAAADRHITDSQQAYGRTRRAAIAAGWTDEELSQLGWVAERGPQPLRRRRPAASARAAQPPTAAAPELGPADPGAATPTSAEPNAQDPGCSSGDPSAALPGGPGRDETPAAEAVPRGYPDPQPA